ncbi:MAG: hypothetical protein NW201_03050 [Gemmatimonadales bacterium]|nr:hypothetical protein [Gemmatimonadales bacterium]
MANMRSAAWLLRGISSVPGELLLQGRTIRFAATGPGSAWPWQLRKLERLCGAAGWAERVLAGERAELFAWEVATVRAWVPWHYFGGGMKLGRDALVLRLSFGRPGNTRTGGVESVGAQLGEVAAMRARGRQWQEALARAGTRAEQA